MKLNAAIDEFGMTDVLLKSTFALRPSAATAERKTKSMMGRPHRTSVHKRFAELANRRAYCIVLKSSP